MRMALTTCFLLAACGGGDDAVQPIDAGGALDGMYRLAWTCMGNCPFTAPLVRTTALDVSGWMLTYDGGGVHEVHRASAESEHCLAVPAGERDGDLTRDAYQICIAELTATATIGWASTNMPVGGHGTWRLAAQQ